MSVIKHWILIIVEVLLTLLFVIALILFANYLSSKGNDEMDDAITLTNNIPKADFGMFDNKVVPGSLVRLAVDNYSKDFIVDVAASNTGTSATERVCNVYAVHYGRIPVLLSTYCPYPNKFATYSFYFTYTGGISDYISTNNEKWNPTKSYIVGDISPYHVTDGKYQKYTLSGGKIKSYNPVIFSMPSGFEGLPQIDADKDYYATNIIDREGQHIGVFFIEERYYKRIKEWF